MSVAFSFHIAAMGKNCQIQKLIVALLAPLTLEGAWSPWYPMELDPLEKV